MVGRTWHDDDWIRGVALLVVLLTGLSSSDLPVLTPTTIDLNRAPIGELALLEGIGPARARRLVDHRPFDDVEDLLDVPGIGTRTLDALRAHVVVQSIGEVTP